jgi:hypothetical protein
MKRKLGAWEQMKQAAVRRYPGRVDVHFICQKAERDASAELNLEGGVLSGRKRRGGGVFGERIVKGWQVPTAI